MAVTLEAHVQKLQADPVFNGFTPQEKQQYLQEAVLPTVYSDFAGFTPQEKQGYVQEVVMPMFATSATNQVNTAMQRQGLGESSLNFLRDTGNVALQQATFGLVNRPETENELANFAGGMAGGVVPWALAGALGLIAPATIPFTFPIAIGLSGAQGIGTDIRDQLDAGRQMNQLNLGRTAFRGAAASGGALLGGRFGTTFAKDAIINALTNAGEVAGVYGLEGQAPDLGQVAKAAGMGVGGSAAGRGLNALLTVRSDKKSQTPSQPTQEQPKSMLEQAEPPQKQVYSSDGMSDRALRRIKDTSEVGTPEDVKRVATQVKNELLQSALTLKGQGLEDTPKFKERVKAFNVVNQLLGKEGAKPPKNIDVTMLGETALPKKPVTQTKPVKDIMAPKPYVPKPTLQSLGYDATPKSPTVGKGKPAKPPQPKQLKPTIKSLGYDATPKPRLVQAQKQVQVTLLKQPIGQLPARPIQALPSMTPSQQAKVQARVKQGGTVLPPSQEVIDVKGKRLIPQPTQGNVPKAMTGKPAEQAKANAVARERATQEAQGFATVLKQADAVPDDASRLRAYKKLRTQAQNKLIADPTNTLAEQRLKTVQGRIDAMTETASNKQAAQAQLAQKAKIKPATVDDTTAKAKEPAKITPKEAGQLLTELYSGDHVGVVDNKTAYEVFEMLGVPVKKVHRDNITSTDVTRFGNQLVFNANLGRQLGTQRIGENETLGGVITRLQKQYPNLNVASIIGGRVVRDPNVLASIGEDVAAVQKAGESLPDNLVSALERGGLTEQAKRDAQIAVPYEKLDKFKKAGFQNMDRAQTPEALDVAFEEFNTQWKALEGDFKALKDEKVWMDAFNEASERWEANSNILKEAQTLGAKPVEPVVAKPKPKAQPAEPTKPKATTKPKPKPKNPLEVQRRPDQPMTPENAKVIGEVAMMNRLGYKFAENEKFAQAMREQDTALARAWLKQNEVTKELHSEVAYLDDLMRTRNFKFGELAYEKGFKDPALEAKFLAEKADRQRREALRPQRDEAIKKLMTVTDNVLLEKAGQPAKVAKAEPKAVDKPAETPSKAEEPKQTPDEQLPTEESLVGATSASTRKKLAKAKEVLARKEEELNRRFNNRFEHTRKTNGQPMNDKRNGQTWFNQADKLDQTIRNQMKEIEKSKAYIDRLENRAAFLEKWEKELPAPLLEAALDGRLNQWKKHPRMFFVEGVEKARIVWNPDTKTIGATYVKEIPNKEQYAIFRDTFNGLRKELGLSDLTPAETPKAKFIPQATDEGRLGTRYTTPNPNMTVRKQKNGNWVVETKQPDGKYGNGVRVADEATAKAYVAKADVLTKTSEVKAKIQDPVNPAKIHANASKVDQLLPLVPDDKKPLVKTFGKAMADGKLVDINTFAEKFGLTVGDDPYQRLDYPYDVDVNPKTGDVLLKVIRQTDGQPRTRLVKEGQLGFVERKGVMQIPKDTEVKSEITSIKPSDKEVMYRPSYEPDADGKPQLVVRDRDGNIVEQVEAKSVPISGWLADRLTRPEPFEKADIRRAGEEIANMPDLRQVEEVMAKFPEAQRDALRKLVTGLRCQK